MISTERIESQAATFLIRQDGEGWTAKDNIELEAWLSEATIHRVAYLRLKAAWKRADRLAALRVPEVRDRDASPSRRVSSWGRIAAGIAAAAFTGVVFWSMLQVKPNRTYSTRLGEHATVNLSDGTKLELNTATQIETTVTKSERLVELREGEAFFEVTHNDSLPFVVVAGGQRIVDVGTKFSVRRDGDSVVVLVTEGRVKIERKSQPPGTPPLIVAQGNMVVTKASATLVTRKTEEEVANEMSWRRGMLVFENKSLPEAAGEFNRYNRTKLVIDKDIPDIRFGGNFEANNVEAFARLVHEAFGLDVIRQGNELLLTNLK